MEHDQAMRRRSWNRRLLVSRHVTLDSGGNARILYAPVLQYSWQKLGAHSPEA